MTHFPALPSDVHERLRLRGIDPERSCEAWLEAIRDGRYPLTELTRRRAGVSSYPGRYAGQDRSPGAKLVPVPIPLAIVLPA